MKTADFDWDQYFSHASFDEIRMRSPELSARRFPTTFNPDKSRLYLSSQDIDVRTESIDELRSAFDGIKESHAFLKRAQHLNHLKIALARIDFIAVCGLMAGLVETPEDFGDPDQLLES